MPAIPYPPYSLDLSPCDSTIQADNERETDRDNRRNSTATERELRKITPANFQHDDTQWVERWQRCINTNSEYFEGDH